VKFKQKLHDFLKKEIDNKRALNPPIYPGELLLAYGYKDKAPLVLLTEEDPLKVAQDADFFFDKVLLLTEENLNRIGAIIASKDFDLLIIDTGNLAMEIPEQESVNLTLGDNISLEELLLSLDSGGLVRRNRVYEEGEYVNRGGIVDVWALNHKNPLRIELEDEKIASLRFFNPSNQLSTAKTKNTTLLIKKGEGKPLEEMLGGFFKIGPETKNFRVDVKLNSTGYSIPCTPVISFHRNLDHFKQELRKLKNYRIFIAAGTPGEIHRLRDLFDHEFPQIEYLDTYLSKGFIIDKIKLALFTESDIFGALRAKHKTKKEEIPAEAEREFIRGNYIVHEDFGIGRFEGLEIIDIDRRKRECLVVEYKNKSRILVPVEKSGLLTQYISGGEKEPELSELSKNKWETKKRRVKKELEKYAEELLLLYAKRTVAKGYPYAKDNSLISELELSFPFQETNDQEEAINKVYADMEKLKPMDRLLCGEVGFGKTEVALRTAFKAAIESKQSAIITPTTLLAEQHYRTFKERLKKFPINIELLSRFTKKEEKEILEKIKSGKCDIIIGTHMLLNKRIDFKNLGVLIIDEEQRFGVKQKEKLKELRTNIDVLSMSATPIPRTLQFSLLGIRDLSVIQTPPHGRRGVVTNVIHWDERKIKDAVLRETERSGQVFFVHNRVSSIESIREKLGKIIPEVRIVVGHGQLSTEILEKRMTDFLNHKYDLLLSTAIIESGLDLPNVNTIIIDKAENFGLADLHQLRGRVGRSLRQGFCYLIISGELKGKARERISTIKTYSQLGSGFTISLKDLEIRGAGEILGREQHGHIATIGYKLYLKILNEAIKKAKGETLIEKPEVEVSLQGSFYIPKSYIQEEDERIELYRKISSAPNLQEVEKIENEIKDRFGKIPPNVIRILKWARIKILAEAREITKIEEGIKYFSCETKKTLSKPQIEKLISTIEGIKFSYKDKSLTILVPRDSIFEFLETFQN
jgi:transcription-repair coupling factor (superfamily II helicase)